MHAMVFDATTRTFFMQEFAIPKLQEGEILVRVRCCTICGSDLHTFCGRRNGPNLCILGHEIIGEIDSWFGPAPPTDYHGNHLGKGQRVSWSLVVSCKNCICCKSNLPQKCVSVFKYGHQQHSDQHASGGLSEYCVLKAGTQIIPVPDELPDVVACPVNCATATVNAAVRLASEIRPINGCTAIVTGMGMLGLTACAMLQKKGAEKIVAVDTNPARLELALRFGATHSICINPSNSSQQIDVSQITGERPDIALEFSGVPTAVNQCIGVLRPGGVAVLAGSVFPSDSIVISPEDVVRRMLTIRGIHNYAPQDLAEAMRFACEMQTEYPFSELVLKTFSLSDTQSAFQYSIDSQAIRVAVSPFKTN
jgi:putative phosphonate catabolism associated alcohol dehydrogenase